MCDKNNRSKKTGYLASGSDGAILFLSWRNFSTLLPLGADAESLEQVRSGLLPASVTALLLSDGGSEKANPPAWLARWQHQVVLLSVVSGDLGGRPAAEVLAELEG